MSEWNILVVDDEPDIHNVTRLALRRRRLMGSSFKITSAASAAEAIEILGKEKSFQAALVDVVMESSDAGLKVCEYIRSNCPPSMRIILRTGQPGAAPEEDVMSNFDIDYYMAKSEATPDYLFTVLRACIRSSRDISTLLTIGHQLRDFTYALPKLSSLQDLQIFMDELICFLEVKHSGKITFCFNFDDPSEKPIRRRGAIIGLDDNELFGILRNMPIERYNPTQMVRGGDIGIMPSVFVTLFMTHQSTENDVNNSNLYPKNLRGAIIFRPETDERQTRDQRGLLNDMDLFVENWCIAYNTLAIKERADKEYLLRQEMYQDRLLGITRMVASVAHELNTPLGVAITSLNMVTDLTKEMVSPQTDPKDIESIAEDIIESCNLLGKNLNSANRLIKSFKQLSTNQLVDDKVDTTISEVVWDCVDTMNPQLRQSKIGVTVTEENIHNSVWSGYPGHLSQVLINMFQNVIRYAYGPEGGAVEINIRENQASDEFYLVFSDKGKGVEPSILPNIFAPFVTSARGKGGTGLGMAITQNLVVNNLGGTIVCKSTPSMGTQFNISLPRVAPDPKVVSGDLNDVSTKKDSWSNL